MSKKFDDPQFRERFLDHIRAGHGRYEACKIVQVHPETFRSYYKASKDFRDEVEEALNASVEPVMTVLRELALEGDTTAAKEYLKHQAPPPRGEADRGKQTLDINVVHEIDPAKIQTLAELEARLNARQAALPPAPIEDYEEADLVEDEDD